MDEIWDQQKKAKYRDHDLVVEDLKLRDIDTVRSAATRSFIETRESDNVTLIISAFMGFLTSQGYRIVKKETK